MQAVGQRLANAIASTSTCKANVRSDAITITAVVVATLPSEIKTEVDAEATVDVVAFASAHTYHGKTITSYHLSFSSRPHIHIPLRFQLRSDSNLGDNSAGGRAEMSGLF